MTKSTDKEHTLGRMEDLTKEDLTMENNTAKEFTSKLMAPRHSAYGKKERRVFCVRTALNGLNSKTKYDFIFLKKAIKP